jgi:hypothetical protein
MTVKCMTAIKALILHLNLCLSVMLSSLSCSFSSINSYPFCVMDRMIMYQWNERFDKLYLYNGSSVLQRGCNIIAYEQHVMLYYHFYWMVTEDTHGNNDNFKLLVVPMGIMSLLSLIVGIISLLSVFIVIIACAVTPHAFWGSTGKLLLLAIFCIITVSLFPVSIFSNHSN